MNSKCAFDHQSAFRLVSKNRSTTMALSWLAVLPHRRAALRLTTAVPVSTAVQTASGNDFAAVWNPFWIDGAMSGAQTLEWESVANPDFHADLCGVVHPSDTPALMLNKYRAELTKYWLARDGSRDRNERARGRLRRGANLSGLS